MDRKENIELIIFRYLSFSATEEESTRLLEWLKESRENRITYFTLKKIWLNTHNDGYTEKNIDDSWNRLKLRTTLQGQKNVKDAGMPRINIRKLAVAATILVLIGITSFLGIQLRNFTEFDETMTELSVPLGARINMTLPDGTNVWLNAGSKLTYRSDFGRSSRDVTLSGEAYFDVQQQGNSIFSVNTHDMNIKVLGTQFNVKSYPDEEVTETTIVSGRVEVNVTETGIIARPVLLTQNQRIIYSRAEGSIVSQPVETADDEFVVEDAIEDAAQELVQKPSLQISQISSPEEYTSWKDGKLVFRGENLVNLSRKLERFYNVNISFEDDTIKELSYTGTLEEVSIEEVLRAIATASNINFKLDKNNVMLSN